ncbi:MAG TPA: hypothetical protein ENO20_14190 [Bacteroides sp.]|nr:hypothetical protein [Bacteroides sp.]
MEKKKHVINKKVVVQAIIDKIENEHDDFEIKTGIVEGYGRPEKIIRKGDQGKGYVPDVILESDQRTELFEVELDDDFELDKWKLFSLYTTKMKGNFNIVTPEAILPQVREVLNSENINAKIIYFS